MKKIRFAALSSLLLAPQAQAINFVVSNTESGLSEGSLQQAVVDANENAGPDTITFDASISGEITINDNLYVNDDLYINGSAAPTLTIEVNAYDDHTIIARDADLSLSNLAFNPSGNDFRITLYDSALSLSNISVGRTSDYGGAYLITGNSDLEIVFNEAPYAHPDESYISGGIAINLYSEPVSGGIEQGPIIISPYSITNSYETNIQPILIATETEEAQPDVPTITFVDVGPSEEEPLSVEVGSLVTDGNNGSLLFTSEPVLTPTDVETTEIEVTEVETTNTEQEALASSNSGFTGPASIISLLWLSFLRIRKKLC